MKKLLLTLAAATFVSVSASAVAYVAPPCGTQLTNADFADGANPMTNGTIIALQCMDTNGGANYYFNGATAKTSTFSYSNLVRVVTIDGGSDFYLQMVGTGKYIAQVNDNNDSLIREVDATADALTFSAAIGTPSNWTTIVEGVVSGTNTVRFSTTNSRYLNTNNTNLTPKLYTGSGGFSAWYVYTFSDAEVSALQGVDVTYTFPDPVSGSFTKTVANVAIGSDATAAIPNVDFFNVTGVSQTNTTVSADNKTFTVQGTWDLMDFDRVYRAKFRQTQDLSATDGNRTGNKYWLYKDGTSWTRNGENEGAFIAARLWYFEFAGIVNGEVRVKLHNVAAPANEGLTLTSVNTTDNANLGSFSTDATSFIMRKNNKTSDADVTYGSFVLQHPDAPYAYVNDAKNHVAIWNPGNVSSRNDQGSTISLYALAEADWDNTSWTTSDGLSVDFDATKKQTAQANPTPENLRALFTIDAFTRDMAVANLNAYLDAQVAQLAATELYSAEAARAIVADVEIPATADSFETVLEEKKAEANSKIWAAIRSAINGKKITLKNISATNGNYDYMTCEATTGVIKHRTAFGLGSVWMANINENNEIRLTNCAYEVALNEFSAGETATSYTLSMVRTDGSFALQNKAVSGKNFLHQGENNNMKYWDGADSNVASHWRLAVVTAEQEQALIDAINAKPEGAVEGENPGEYTFNEFVATAGQLDYPAALAASNIWTLNPVASGRFIRIKSILDRYFSMPETGDNCFVTEADNSTILFFDGTNIISYQQGVAVKSGNFMRSRTSAAENAALAANASEVSFNAAPISADASHRYLVNFNGGGRTLFNGEGGNSNWSADVANAGGVITSTAGDNRFYTFMIEYVDELPVAIHSHDNCGSIIAPVALVVPQGDYEVFKASTAADEQGDDKLKFEKLTAGTVIPAGTPVILHVPSGSENSGIVNMPVSYEAAEPAVALAADTDRFGGSHLTLGHTAVDGECTYVKKEYNGEQSQENVGKVSFVKVNEGEAYPAGAVTVRLVDDSGENAEAPEAVYYSLDGSLQGVTTAISEISVETGASDAIYDLQGRRLSAPVKGINIIGGRKVLVK